MCYDSLMRKTDNARNVLVALLGVCLGLLGASLLIAGATFLVVLVTAALGGF